MNWTSSENEQEKQTWIRKWCQQQGGWCDIKCGLFWMRYLQRRENINKDVFFARSQWSNRNGSMDFRFKGRGFDSRPFHCQVTLSKLFTCTYQAVLFGTVDQRWCHTSGKVAVALAMRDRLTLTHLSGLSTYSSTSKKGRWAAGLHSSKKYGTLNHNYFISGGTGGQ